jgi:hypothetical protein
MKDRKETRIISFSLYGDDPKYVEGLLHNLKLAEEHFPDWYVFVFGQRISSDTIIKIDESELNITLYMSRSKVPPMFHRMFIWDVPGVDRFICRDTDDRLSRHDAAMVNNWIETGLPFHVARCVDVHHMPILGGLWGGMPKELNMQKEVEEWYKHNAGKNDQQFLAEVIWPLIKTDCATYGKVFDFEAVHRRSFPGSSKLGGVYEPHIKTWEEVYE